MFELIFRAIRMFTNALGLQYSQIVTRIKLSGNGVIYGKGHKYKGIPYIKVNRKGSCILGENLSCNSGDNNPIGSGVKTYIVVGAGASLSIGNSVGMSNVAINCYESITIGNHVKLGGGVGIYDTDFHSLDYKVRADYKLDLQSKVTKPVTIGDNAFIGAHAVIMKGVSIGERAIIGTGSVVTKDIPSDEIWAGNPAKFIKKI